MAGKVACESAGYVLHRDDLGVPAAPRLRLSRRRRRATARGCRARRSSRSSATPASRRTVTVTSLTGRRRVDPGDQDQPYLWACGWPAPRVAPSPCTCRTARSRPRSSPSSARCRPPDRSSAACAMAMSVGTLAVVVTVALGYRVVASRAPRAGTRCPSCVVRWFSTDSPRGTRQRLRHGAHEGRLVALPAMRNGSKIRAVGLNSSRSGGQVVLRSRSSSSLERDHAAEGKVRRDRIPRLEHARTRAERVQHDRRLRTPEHRRHVVVGLGARAPPPALPSLAGEHQLGLEGATLRVPRRMVVVVIEPRFPERHHFG